MAQPAQYQEIVNQHNSWYALGFNYEYSKKLSFDISYEFRRTDWGSKWTQSFFQGMSHYKPNKHIILHGGLLFLKHFPYGKQPGFYEWLEFRPVIQTTFAHQIGRFKLKNRHTLALRINEVKDYNTTQEYFERNGFQTLPWYRNRIAVQAPLNQTTLEPKTFYLNMSEEVFFGLGRNAPEHRFVQNRLIAGAGYIISEKHKLQLGYMLQRINKADGIQAERNHTSQLKYVFHLERKKS